MNCDICGNPLLYKRVVFRCQYRALIHAYSWEKHVTQSHTPRFTPGYVALNDKFRPRKPEIEESRAQVEKAGRPLKEEVQTWLIVCPNL